MLLNFVYMVSNLNADDIRRIVIQTLFEMKLITDSEIEKVDFIDLNAKYEILDRISLSVEAIAEPIN